MSNLGSLFNLRPLLRSGAVLFVGMTVANVGAYTASVLAGRLLGPDEFGTYLSLISLAVVLTMPVPAFATVAAKFTSSLHSSERQSELRGLFTVLTRSAIGAGFAMLILLVVIARPLAAFLNLNSVTPIIAVAVGFAGSFLLPVVRGFLQGLQRFSVLALNTALEPIIRIGALVGFVWLGFGVSGALVSYAVAFGVSYLIGRFALRSILSGPRTAPDQAAIWRYSAPTVVALSLLAFLTSFDVVLVKHYFDAETAGLYAALATIGKTILYVSTPLIVVMFPLIVTKVTAGDRHFPLLLQTLIVILTLSLGVLAIFSLFPLASVRLLFGSQYLAVAPYLPGFGLAMLFLSLATVFVHYFLSIGRTAVSWALVVAFSLEVGLIVAFHTTLGHLITTLTVVFAALFVGLSGSYLWLKRRQLGTVGQWAFGSENVLRSSETDQR